MKIFFTLAFLTTSAWMPCEGGKEGSMKLKHDLLIGYDPLVLPRGKNATHLAITLHPQSINLDEKTSTFTLSGVLVMGWMDERIRWDPANYGDTRYVFFRYCELWKPELTVYNGAPKKNVHVFGKERMVATSTGSIFWSPVVRFDTKCTHNFKVWPFDKTTCVMQIGSWYHSGDDVFMEVWNPEDPHLNLTDLIPNPDWDIQLSGFGIRDEVFECCPSYQEFYVNWSLQRRYGHPFAAIYIPAIAIAWMILTTFWMNPKATERSALVLTSFILNSFFLKYVYSTIPPNGDDVPLIIVYYRNSMVLVCFALLWTVCSRFIASTKRASNIPLPAPVFRFLDSWPSKILFIAPRPQNPSCASKMTEYDSSLIGLQSTIQNDWAWLAHLLDRIIFAVYLLTYLVFLVAYL